MGRGKCVNVEPRALRSVGAGARARVLCARFAVARVRLGGVVGGRIRWYSVWQRAVDVALGNPGLRRVTDFLRRPHPADDAIERAVGLVHVVSSR